ncbi:hypothetical protein BDN70DRAFT_887485 [Pholiota conissans]|uniref:Uncharacterized protein n=1 Tax=Pholiota conissans TaxID=109636 RepID=A0A9P5YNC4_9AGAR|nr:hypothetical protein BDN70DRAFT_887485 [Pholiota conissans]
MPSSLSSTSSSATDAPTSAQPAFDVVQYMQNLGRQVQAQNQFMRNASTQLAEQRQVIEKLDHKVMVLEDALRHSSAYHRD